MSTCAVYGCKNYAKKASGLRFYTFPKDPEVRKLWIDKCKRKDQFNMESARICSIHFDTDCFKRNLQHELLQYRPKNYRDIKDGSLPTLHLPTSVCEKPGRKGFNSNKERKRKSLVNDLLKKASLPSGTVEKDFQYKFENNMENSSQTNENNIDDTKNNETRKREVDTLNKKPNVKNKKQKLRELKSNITQGANFENNVLERTNKYRKIASKNCEQNTIIILLPSNEQQLNVPNITASTAQRTIVANSVPAQKTAVMANDKTQNEMDRLKVKIQTLTTQTELLKKNNSELKRLLRKEKQRNDHLARAKDKFKQQVSDLKEKATIAAFAQQIAFNQLEVNFSNKT